MPISKSEQKLTKIKKGAFGVSFLTTLLLFCAGWYVIKQHESVVLNEQRNILKNELTARTDTLANLIEHRLSLLPSIRAYIVTNQELYKTHPQKFEKTARRFLKNIYGNVSNIKSIAIFPDGAQQYLYPNSDFNLTEIEKNLLMGTKVGFHQGIKRNVLSLKGPFYSNNKNEELGMTARLAIYQNGVYWGVISMLLNIEPMIAEANLQNLKNGLFQFAYRKNGKAIFYGDKADFKGTPIVDEVTLPGFKWEVSITRPNALSELSFISLCLINLLFSSLIGSLLYIYLTKKKYSKKDRLGIAFKVRQDQKVLNAIFQALPDLYFHTTKDGTILEYRASQLDTFHVTSESFLNVKIHKALPQEIGRVFKKKMKQYFETEQLQTFEYTLQAATGKYDYEARLTGFPDSDDLIIVIREVTQRKKSEELIWYQANYDPLTKLPNRRMLHDKLGDEIIKSNRTKQTLALLFIDLDRFKDVNDNLGHDMGDELLIEAAKRIINCIRDSDTVARLGGDEFTVILSELDELNSVERIAQKIIKSLSQQFSLGKNLANISASIGISIYPNDAKDANGLLRNADLAMYRSKTLGRSRFSYFTMAMQQEANFRSIILGDMQNALVEKQFQLYFQPIVDLKTHEIYKAEALIRWNHPKVGLVEPDAFISLAEETGLISDIGNWVFRAAAKQVKNFKEQHGIDVQISINKSPIQFQTIKNHKKWIKYLQLLELSGENLAIEITEGSLIENDDEINRQLVKFRDLGMQVSLDDFGTVFSSLSYLKKFDIDFLKLDQAFTRNLAPGSEDMVLSEAIIIMAHKLGLKVIAEGIETEQQRQLLIEAGCDFGQGFLISKPLPADEFIKFLKGKGRTRKARNDVVSFLPTYK